MSNELAAFADLPEHLKGYLTAEHRQDSGTLKPSDFGINMLKICQGQSREARPGQNGEPALGLGTMFMARNRAIVPPGTMFVPLLRTVRYIKWIGRPGEGRMEFTCTDANDKRIVACDGLTWLTDERTGKQLKPLVTEYVNFYIMLQGFYDEPVLLSYSRTSAKRGRQLTRDIVTATKFGKLPYRALSFKLGAFITEHDSSNEWYHINAVGAGFAPVEIKDKADKMYELACMMRDASTGMELASADSETEDDEARFDTMKVATSAPAATPAAAAGTVQSPANITPQPVVNAAPAAAAVAVVQKVAQPMQPEAKGAW